MPEIKIVNMAGAEVGSMTLSDAVFASEVNGAVLHAAVKSYLANQRQGTQSTLTRTEVSGGGKKQLCCFHSAFLFLLSKSFSIMYLKKPLCLPGGKSKHICQFVQ